MRKTLLPVIILGIISLVACKKDKDKKSEYPLIYEHDCVSTIKSYDGIRLCFDKVIADQRCPDDVECFWEGYAIGQFTFTKANNAHVLSLYVRGRDTVVDGYKIKFVELTPHPLYHPGPGPRKPYKAEVEVTKM